MSPLDAAPPAQAEANKSLQPFKIYMVLWRGITNAEKGFMDFLVNQDAAAPGKRGTYDVNFIIRNCRSNKKRLEDFKKEIREIKPDLIYTFGTTATIAITGKVGPAGKQAGGGYIRDIPVIFNVVNDPRGAALVDNMKSPGRNLTGVSHAVPLLVQVERMKAVFQFKRLAMFYNPGEKNSRLAVEKLERLAGKNGFQLIKAPLPLDDRNRLLVSRLPAMMDTCLLENPDLVYLPSDSTVIANAKKLMELVHIHRLPSFSATESPITGAGALMGVVGSYYDVGKAAGQKAIDILVHKKKIKKIPIKMLPHFTFLVNIDTLHMLGVRIPPKILRSARFTGNLDPEAVGAVTKQLNTERPRNGQGE
jgi:putative ABC transport system substrate-binding protein